MAGKISSFCEIKYQWSVLPSHISSINLLALLHLPLVKISPLSPLVPASLQRRIGILWGNCRIPATLRGFCRHDPEEKQDSDESADHCRFLNSHLERSRRETDEGSGGQHRLLRLVVCFSFAKRRGKPRNLPLISLAALVLSRFPK